MATKTASKFSLEQMETTIAVLASMQPEIRKDFVSKIDEFKSLHGKELDDRLSKAVLRYRQLPGLAKVAASY